ncbi:DUF4307 domain-containing protein [Actinospica robiniae]|uniref:DUF4307 domain-containing protein n=1 Tax=Actinospica robiniae TaxID=304901 RepID=UPI000425B324|nr:DUF4307 domain-containing protein [Actinospica robiniae]
MTEYSATDQPRADEPQDGRPDAETAPTYTDPDFASRYGVKGGMSRTRKITLGVAGICVLAGVAGYIGWNEAHPEVQATVISFTTSGNSATVRFEVDKPANEMLECTLEAEDVKGEVIGTVNVPVLDKGTAKLDQQTTISATGTPNTVIVANCVKA